MEAQKHNSVLTATSTNTFYSIVFSIISEIVHSMPKDEEQGNQAAQIDSLNGSKDSPSSNEKLMQMGFVRIYSAHLSMIQAVKGGC